MHRLIVFLSVLSFSPIAAAQIPHPDSISTEQVHEIERIVVTGTRNKTDIRHLPMTVSVVERQTIEHANEPSLLPILTEQVPGLFAAGRGIMGYGVSGGAAGQLSVRGIGGPVQEGVPTTGMLVLIDGHPQYMGLFGHPVSDACQSFLAERVEVLRGPASVLYGSNAMGGVINIVTRKIREDGIKTHINTGYGSFNTLQTEVTNRIRKGRFTSVVSGSYNRTDGHRPDMGFEQYGGYAKLGYEIAENWNIWADMNITHFNASNPGTVYDPLTDADQRVTRGMASLALENEYGNTSGTLSFFYNWGRHWLNDGYHPADSETPLDYRFNSKDHMAGASWYQSVRMFRGNRLTVGVDYFRFGGESWNQPTDGSPREQLVDKTEHEIAGYIDFRQRIVSWLTFDAGLRLDHHSRVGTEWIPQAGFSFDLPRNVLLKISAAKGFRYPTIRELYMFRPANPDLKPERLWSYEIAFSQQVAGGRLSYGLNLYHIRGGNLIMRIPVDGRPMNVNTGRIRNTGGEIQAAYRIGTAWSIDANYSYLHMEQPVLASPEHKLYAGVLFAHKRWNVSTGVQYVAGLYTEVKVAGQGEYKTENFVLWNMRASFRATKWLSVWVRGENLLAQRYEILSGFPMPRATVTAGVNITF